MTDRRDQTYAQATRLLEVRNILTGHCGELLTPDKVDGIVREIAKAMNENAQHNPSPQHRKVSL
jgi:hypothetical protein